MSEGERGIEAKVGAFVFLGLAAVAALVVQFGRIGEGWKTYYPLSVQFTDASGLLKGSDVLLAGAKIGRVSGGPHLVSAGNGVTVPLRIYDYVKLPVGSKFTVGSSGLLGDRFVSVTMPPGKPNGFIPKDSVIAGTRETGLDDITREGGALVQDLRGTVQNVNATVTRLNQQALSQDNMQNLKASIEHLNQATGALAESSRKIDGVVDKAGATMSSTKQASDDLQKAIGDARKTIQATTQMMNEATNGKGMLATLLTNQQLANDLEALISNLRRHGVLFYRDSAAKTESKAQDLRQSERETPRKGRR
jgi:phospholipid/cholesterol/gamma-HCH transport system substrate-binding protein